MILVEMDSIQGLPMELESDLRVLLTAGLYKKKQLFESKRLDIVEDSLRQTQEEVRLKAVNILLRLASITKSKGLETRFKKY